jgi:hypothetical protein
LPDHSAAPECSLPMCPEFADPFHLLLAPFHHWILRVAVFWFFFSFGNCPLKY